MRTVVAFERLGTDTVVKLSEAPRDIPGIEVDNAVIDLAAPPGGTARQRGAELLARICAHPPVRAGLDLALGTPPGSPPAPLYFHVLAAAADALPWEELYADGHGFCALDPRWPVARIAARRRAVTDRVFTGELNVVAVLSAAGRSGVSQLETLLAATGSADGAAVGSRLRVISGDERVLAALAAANRPDVSAEQIASGADGLIRQIAAGDPDVLHLLGHGGEPLPGVRTLAFATSADFDADDEAGSVRLQLAHLTQAVLSADPWLVVLSACESAGAGSAGVLAHDLASGGVPAVIGMRRLIDIDAADRCCAALYPQLLTAVRRAVDPAAPAGIRLIDWAAALTAPRAALCGPDPTAVDTWSDPVLYVQHEPFRVLVAPREGAAESYQELRGELDWLEEFMETAGAHHERLRADVIARIGQLREQLARTAPGAVAAIGGLLSAGRRR